MSRCNELLKGNIYFFYRPKIEQSEAHTIDDVQRFFMVLKLSNLNKFILLIIGKKHMPKKGETYFTFVDKVTTNFNSILKAFKDQTYTTETKGKRNLPKVRCIGEGNFLILEHEKHSHLIYKLSKPKRIGKVQKEFNLQQSEDLIINVKNPKKSSPTTGLGASQKADYKKALIDKLDNYSFISLIPVDFLYYEGAELLLIRSEEWTGDKEVEKCIEAIPKKDITNKLKEILDKESIAPLIDTEWA